MVAGELYYHYYNFIVVIRIFPVITETRGGE